jgi:hypothetical protein
MSNQLANQCPTNWLTNIHGNRLDPLMIRAGEGRRRLQLKANQRKANFVLARGAGFATPRRKASRNSWAIHWKHLKLLTNS